MPHWNAIINTSSPELLEECNGDPVCVRRIIMAEAPQGANVTSISWLTGEDRARVTVEGPNATSYLGRLEATDVVELLSARERKEQKG